MSDPQDIPEDEALAAEYVLGLLDDDAASAFEARLLNEPELRAFVQFWEAEFAMLTDDLAPQQPPASLKRRLLSKLDGERQNAQRLWGWKWLAFPSLIAIAVAAVIFIGPILRGPVFDPAFHATLISENGAIHIEAGYAPNGMLFKVIPDEGRPQPGRDFELWVIGEGSDVPVSLGVISTAEESLFEISAEIAALIEGGTLAVSDEPEGGSPTGAPTGEILAIDEFFEV